MKIFIPGVGFYGDIYFLKKFAWGFVGWFLSALLLFEIIVSMKRCYVSVLEFIKKCVGFVCVLF